MTQAINFKQIKALPVYKQTKSEYWANGPELFYPFLYAVAKQQKDRKAVELLRSYMAQKGIKPGRKSVSSWLETDGVGQRKPKASKAKRKASPKVNYRKSKASSSAKQKLVYKAIEALTELAELV